MSYPNNEGPTLIPQRVVVIDEYITCQGCKFHTHKLMRSGKNPIYSDGCIYPGLQCNLTRDIDQNLITPEWCPFLKQQSII